MRAGRRAAARVRAGRVIAGVSGAALLLASSGCSLIGLAIGSGLHSGPANVRVLTLAELEALSRPVRLWIATTDGDTLSGTFVAIEESSPARYASRVTAWRQRHPDAPVLPSPGEDVRLVLRTPSAAGRVVRGAFTGFGVRGVQVRSAAGRVTAGLEDVDSLVGVAGAVSGAELARWDSLPGLPSTTLLRIEPGGRGGSASSIVDDGGRTVRVPLNRGATVGELHRASHAAAGFLVGVVLDAMFWYSLSSFVRH